MLARRYDIIVYMISHVRKTQDVNDYATIEDLKNSSSIAQDSDIVLFIYGTKLGHEISIEKARMSKSKLRIPIIFNGETGRMEDDNNREVKHFGEKVEEENKQISEF